MIALIKQFNIEAKVLGNRIQKPRNRQSKFAPVTFSEARGVRYLHFGSPWIQGAMRLSQPNQLVLRYAQQMMAWLLFIAQPKKIVQLGLGAASLTKFAYHVLNAPAIEVVEINESVIAAAQTMFDLHVVDSRLQIVQADAWDFVHHADHQGQAQIMQVDLYDATAQGPVLSSLDFYRAARNCLAETGILVVNLFGQHTSFAQNMKHLNLAFEQRVFALPTIHDGNRIAFAFVGDRQSWSLAQLTQRAQAIQTDYGLPALSWLKALKKVVAVDPFSI